MNETRYILAIPQPKWLGIYDTLSREYIVQEYDKDGSREAMFRPVTDRLNIHWRDSCTETEPDVCEWRYDVSVEGEAKPTKWIIGCNGGALNLHTWDICLPAAYDMHYCPYCSGSIKIVEEPNAKQS